MNRRELLICLGAAVGLASCARRAPSWVRASDARYGEPTPLPTPSTEGTLSLEQAIGRRRSMREYRADPLPLATVGQLFWAGQGVTSSDLKRAAPSAGALYPLELYAVSADQVLHYLPIGHRVETRAAPDLRPEVQAAAFGQEHVGAAPMIVVVAAVADRTTHKYGARGAAFVEREAGHAAQNILLQAAARDLAAVPVGSFDPARVAEVLGLPAGQAVHYLIPVGERR